MAIFGLSVPGKSSRWMLAEMAVVILGILIALQVDQWRAGINDRNQERVLLENMLDDFAFNKQLLITFQDALRCQIRISMEYVDYLESNRARDEQELTDILFSCAWYIWTPTSPTYSGWRDLGRPDLISNQEVRKSLNEYYEGLIPFMITLTAKIQETRDSLTEALLLDWRLKTRGNPETGEFTSSQSAFLPLEDIPRDPRFYAQAENWISMAINLDQYVSLALASLSEMQSSIDAHLEQL